MSVKQYFSALTILYLALLGGQVFFLLIASYMKLTGQYPDIADAELTQVLMMMAAVFVIGGMAGSFFIPRIQLNAIKSITILKEKLMKYRGAMIVKYALLEAPCFFALVCYLLTGHYLFTVLAGLVILVFLIHKPSKEKAIEELELSQQERLLLNDPNTLV